jgi:hypothetical protein
MIATACPNRVGPSVDSKQPHVLITSPTIVACAFFGNSSAQNQVTLILLPPPVLRAGVGFAGVVAGAAS